MGNTAYCSAKPSSPSKKISSVYKLETNCTSPNRIRHYKDQIHSDPIFFRFICKGNMFIALFIHNLLRTSISS